MNYLEIMELILEYGKDKQKLGLMIGKTPFIADEYQDLEDHKQAILKQICDVLLKLTKEA